MFSENSDHLYSLAKQQDSKDEKEAIRYYTLAADKGHKGAQFLLAVKYLTGKGISADQKLAYHYFKLAADQGDRIAQYNIGVIYSLGKSVPEDQEKATHYYKLAADQGERNSQSQLAYRYKKGLGIAVDLKESAHYFKLAADQGDKIAQYHIGVIYTLGRGVPEDPKEAGRYFKLAADQGERRSQFNLGILYSTGGHGIPKDQKEAVRYFKLAADQGDREAQLNLGILYSTGQGVLEDQEKATHYFKLAADQGEIHAQSQMGYRYGTGKGVALDQKEGARYYKLAADQGEKSAQFNLGVMYSNGKGIPTDQKEAARYFKLAADQGHKNAPYHFAIYCQNSACTPENNKQALDYMQLGASRGNVYALHNLAIRYSIGRGVEKDLKKATHYYKLATEVDEDDAFRQFSIKSEAKHMNVSSLFLKISEKKGSTISEQPLYQYLHSENVDLTRSYIPPVPPLATTQRGPTCGLTSLEIALRWGYPDRPIPPARKNPIKPAKEEKEKNKKMDSLRKAAKKNGSVTGEVYNIDCLDKTAKELGFQSEVIEDKEQYIEKILHSIKSGHSIIIPVDVDKNAFPANRKGKNTHYGLAWGYIYKDNQYHLLVTQHGKHFLWPADFLLKSHEQMPDINPRAGEYYKNHERDGYFPKVEGLSIPESDRRMIPPSDLKKFKFHALAIPAPRKNLLDLEETKIDARVAVENSDSIMLKLFTEAHGISQEDYEACKKIAKEKADPFSLQVLDLIKPIPTASIPKKEPPTLTLQPNDLVDTISISDGGDYSELASSPFPSDEEDTEEEEDQVKNTP